MSGDGIQILVDIGSGKGYLSQILAQVYRFKILAVDSATGNTEGADKRSKR